MTLDQPRASMPAILGRYVTADRCRLLNVLASSCYCVVSQVIVGADNPEPVPNAGTKSCDDKPCRYSSGNTSVIFDDSLHHAGRITDENRRRSPVATSTRVSLTRGPTTSTAPDDVSTRRGTA